MPNTARALPALLLAVSLAACQTDSAPGPTTTALSTATADASASVSTISYEITTRDGRGKLAIPGTLRVPKAASGKVPAVLLLHSAGGIDGTGHGHAVNLNAAGFATLEIDMFRPRGRTDLGPIRQQDVVGDVYGALKFLAEHPAIDPDRIAVAGYSFGGTLAILTLEERRQFVHQQITERRFAAHIAYYPVCYFFNGQLGGKSAPFASDARAPWTGRPLLIITGANDEYEAPDTCVKLRGLLPDANRDATTVHVYPGVSHGFDEPRSRSYHDYYACFGNGCQVRHSFNAAVTADAYRREVEFLRKAFGIEAAKPASGGG